MATQYSFHGFIKRVLHFRRVNPNLSYTESVTDRARGNMIHSRKLTHEEKIQAHKQYLKAQSIYLKTYPTRGYKKPG